MSKIICPQNDTLWNSSTQNLNHPVTRKYLLCKRLFVTQTHRVTRGIWIPQLAFEAV